MRQVQQTRQTRQTQQMRQTQQTPRTGQVTNLNQVHPQQNMVVTTADQVAKPFMARLRFGLLIGLLVTLVLTLMEMGVLWLVNPLHALASTRLVGLLTLPVHVPLLLTIPLVEFVIFSLLLIFGVVPVALVSYLKEVNAAQEPYHQLYTPLTAMTNIRQVPVANTVNQQGTPGATAPVLEERIAILDLVQQQDTDQLILGVPGAGKTTAMRVYQYLVSQHPVQRVFHRKRIPVYVPMKNYSLFLKTYLPPEQALAVVNASTISTVAPGVSASIGSDIASLQTHNIEQNQSITPVTLFDFLVTSDLPGMSHLRPYLQQLARQGRLLLLCDGLNEVDSNYLPYVSHELVHLMRYTENRLVMTCREVDYREQSDLIQLVNEGRASRATVYPLQTDQINEFVEKYVERQDNNWRHTAGQIIQVIDKSRLRYHCTNPMMLFTLMGIIDNIGVERGKQIDTRGLLLREYVKQLLTRERRQEHWRKEAPPEHEVVRFLSEIACAARWTNDRNAIQLRVASVTESDRGVSIEELSDELQVWLDEHPAQSPFVLDVEPPSEPYDTMQLLLQFALGSGLIEISPSGVLSFRHELIAEYFVAEYFYDADSKRRALPPPLRVDLLENVGRWSESVAIWAGLLDDPLNLAERFGELGENNLPYVLQALALALVCVGVQWTPPQAEKQRSIVLPQSVADSLAIAVRNRAAREELAQLFTRCAEEGGQEVYRSLLPLITVPGVDELLVLLDQNIVPNLLFTHLEDTIDLQGYDEQAKSVTRVLGRFGHIVVGQAAELSQPAPDHSVRLRSAAINVLGYTRDSHAVEPLIARISDGEQKSVVPRAVNALIRLGPDITLSRLLQELENIQPGPFTSRMHQAVLYIFDRFLDEPDERRQVSIVQYQRILEAVVPVLTANYQNEPDVQRQARALLVKQGQKEWEDEQNEPHVQNARALVVAGTIKQESRAGKVVEVLARHLASPDDIMVQNTMQTLIDIGDAATLHLLNVLHQSPPEGVQIRILDIFKSVRDPRALSTLLNMLDLPSPLMQQHVTEALHAYMPESIPGLINLVLYHPSEQVAVKATQLLGDIGEPSVLPVTDALATIVPERTRLLVQVLERLHDPRSLDALMDLLRVPQLEPLLIIAVIRALGQFSDPRIVPALLGVLSDPRPQVYEEAIDSLSQLGEAAISELLIALEEPEHTVQVQRVQRAILGMHPFPGSSLMAALPFVGDAQAQHIMEIFMTQGADAALVLVRNLLHSNARARHYIQQALNAMPGAIVVPALLDVLNQPRFVSVVTPLLLRYPDAAVSPLVELLGEPERGNAAAAILPQFGTQILRPLLSGLEDPRDQARDHAERILVDLVQQSQDEREQQETVREIVQLFAPTPPPRAHEFLLETLTNELATLSVPILLDALEDAYLMNDAAEALVRMISKGTYSDFIVTELLESLYVDERRRGAEDALIKTGAPVVPGVGALITDTDDAVAHAAKHILSNIGIPALPFVWSTFTDKSNPERRAAALGVFLTMPTSVIKDEMVMLLKSDEAEDVAMAVALLFERVHDETVRQYADDRMVPELLKVLLTHPPQLSDQRIMALLLLLGEQDVFDHLLQALDDEPQYRKQLAYLLLQFSPATYHDLLDMFNDASTSQTLRADLASVLGILLASNEVTTYAESLSRFGITPTHPTALDSEQLALAQHALGGLLVGDHWNEQRLRELRSTSKEGSVTHELSSVLLGWRYEPELAQMQAKMEAEQEERRKERAEFMAKIMDEQRRISELENDLDKVRAEHGLRGDELQKTTKEKDALAKEKDTLKKDLDQATKENDKLNDKIRTLQSEKQQLEQQVKQLTASNKP